MIGGSFLDPFNLLILGCAFLFGLIAVIALYPRSAYVMPKGYSGTKRKELLETNGLFKLFAPILHVFEYNNRRIKAPDMKANIEEKLILAGNPLGMNPDEFIGLCEVSGLFFAAFTAFFTYMVFFNVSLVLVIGLGIFGGFFPVLWLNGQGDKRTLFINKNLPYVLDLLVLSMEAGLDFTGSVERIVRGGSKNDPLREELDTALKEMKMGKTWVTFGSMCHNPWAAATRTSASLSWRAWINVGVIWTASGSIRHNVMAAFTRIRAFSCSRA